MNTKLKIIVTATFIGTWGAFVAVHGAEAIEPRKVTVYENGPGSAALLAGDTCSAIERAEKALRMPQPFGALVNLCAAHLLEGNLKAAATFCEQAETAARKGGALGMGARLRDERYAQEITRSNLGVLKALQAEQFDRRKLVAGATRGDVTP